MAALIPDERCVVFGQPSLLANQSATHYIRDQCCHQQGDEASLKCLFLDNLFQCKITPNLLLSYTFESHNSFCQFMFFNKMTGLE